MRKNCLRLSENMVNEDIKIVETDVLVVGGGPAALRAAIEARKEDVGVTVVVKRKLGKSGNAVVSHTGHNAPFGHADPRDNPKVYFHDTIVAGKLVNNQKLVRVMAVEACQRILELESFGVKFEKQNDKFLQRHAPGHTYPRSCYTPRRRGIDVTLPMAKVAKEVGVRVLEETMLVEILHDGLRVLGAVGFNRLTGKIIVFKCRALILATGGAGQIFSATNNTADTTGDGYSIAFNAEVELVDMEFFQFYPHMLTYPFKTLVSPILFKHGAKLLNSERERFMKRYDPANVDLATRDIKARAMALEVMHGRGIKGGIRLDLSEIEEEKLKVSNPHLYEPIKKKGLDYRKAEFIVYPAAHFYMGGIRINERCETSLKGLYACGEVAGGVHGANRLANNAHTETVVFGARAGKFAARWAKESKIEEIDQKKLYSIKEYIYRIGNGREDLEKHRRRFRESMWRNAGLLRNEKGLKENLEIINECYSQIESIRAENSVKKVEVLEFVNMLNVGKLLTVAALARTESRGAHYRLDYPEIDNKNWLKNIIITKDKRGEPKIRLTEVTKIEESL